MEDRGEIVVLEDLLAGCFLSSITLSRTGAEGGVAGKVNRRTTHPHRRKSVLK